ncbi:MAG: hypothetical protein AB7O97_05310 [Planctomycetota bacterium]
MAAPSSFRLSVGELVSTSLGVYFRNFVPFVLLGLVVQSPGIALQHLAAAPAGQEPTLEQAMTGLGLTVLQSVLTFLLTGAISFGVVMQLRGERAPIGQSIVRGLQSFFRVLGTGMLCGLRIVLFTLLLVVPGILEAIRLYVAIPAAAMEGKAGNDAARRSIALVDGSRWQLFGAWLLIVVLSAVFGGVAGMILAGVTDHPADLWMWFEIVVTVPLNTFSSTMMAVAYFLLRKGKENVDAREIARVFD